MDQNLNLQKEGLQLFLETYLTRSGSEDIIFLHEHVGTTQKLAKSINTSIDNGMQFVQLAENNDLYGINHQSTPQDHKWQTLRGLLGEELLTIRVFLLMLTISAQLITGIIWNSKETINSSISNLIFMLLSWTVIVLMRWRASLIMGEGLRHDLAKVSALRGGKKYDINEEDIMVGDLLLIDFNQIIPVSGILISDQQITIDESSFNLGTQRKQSLENCIEQIQLKNKLQLKIQKQKKILSSPILLRGTKLVGGSSFKMIVLSVTQTEMLQLHKHQNKLQSKSIIQLWMLQAEEKLQQMVNKALFIIICFHFIALIFMMMGLPTNNYQVLLKIIIQRVYIVLAMNLLLNTTLMSDLLRGEYLNALNLVGIGEELDRFLSVEQIFVTQNNICKYDKIKLKKAILADLHEPIDISLLPSLQPVLTYNLIYEVISGVGLEQNLPTKSNGQNHKNIIIHINNSKQRVYSSFYETDNHSQAQKIWQDAEDSVSQIMKSQLKSLHQDNKNKINQIIPESILSNEEMRQQQSLHQEIQERRNQFKPEDNKGQLSIKLDDYLGKSCPFSTRKIIKSLGKLAKNPSRTYYFQKYSLQLLENVKFLWIGGRFSPIQTEDYQHLIDGIKRLERQKLIIYLIGMNEGAFCTSGLVFMIGAVGVQIQQEQEVMQKLRQLEEIGINSLFAKFSKEGEDLKEEQLQQLQLDFINRKWKRHDQHFRKMKGIYQKGGRRICGLCMCSNCNCAAQSFQLANIQGFIQVMDKVKCVYDLEEDEIDYLEQGFQQLNITTLKVVGQGVDTRKKLNQIIAGHQLVSAFEDDILLWIVLSVIAICCFFPFNYITFGKLFCDEQLFFAYFYIQLLFAYHHFTGQPELNIRKLDHEANRKCKKMMGWAAKGNILAFMILLIIGYILVMLLPQRLLHETNTPPSSEYNCQVIKSFFHNSHFQEYKCSENNQTFIVYPRLATFIYAFTLISITLRAFLALQNPFKIKNVVYHVGLIGIFMMFLYLFPEILHFTLDGLNIRQLAICWGMGILVVAISELIRGLLNLIEEDKSYHFDLNISLGSKYNDYAQILREYQEGKAIQFCYDD